MTRWLANLCICLLICYCTILSQGQQTKLPKASWPGYTPARDALLDSIEHKTFAYFITEIDKEKGFVRDRSAGYSPASIAAIGFALPCWCIGVERGWLARADALTLTTNLFHFLLQSEQSPAKVATGYKGLYYHFLTMTSGKREWNSELSTIDTGLLFAGIIFARQYFDKDIPEEQAIRDMAEKIISRAKWDEFINGGNNRYTHSITLGWSPEEGMHEMGWVGYNEALILYTIAAGSGMKGIEDAYQAWLNNYDWREPYKGMPFVSFPPLFGHQYSACFIDFRGIGDKYMSSKGFDYFENSRRATIVQQRYAIENPKGWKGYDSLCWGLTACDGPGEKYNKDGKQFLSYAGRGTSGSDLVFFDDGTIAPTAATASLPFAPDIVFPTIENFYNELGPKGLWGKYGFVDAFNLTAGWYDTDYLGIDEGPIVLMIENFRTGFVWDKMMKDKLIRHGLDKLGFRPIADVVPGK